MKFGTWGAYGRHGTKISTVSRFDERIALITIDHPPVNALNGATLTELDIFFDELSCRKEVQAVTITGTGEKCLIAGADISEFLQIDEETGIDFLEKGRRVFNKLLKRSIVLFAAISGDAIGQGLELALACDIRIASETSRFGLPQIKTGLIPWDGGTQRLSRLVGRSKALEMILTGESSMPKKPFGLDWLTKLFRRKTHGSGNEDGTRDGLQRVRLH